MFTSLTVVGREDAHTIESSDRDEISLPFYLSDQLDCLSNWIEQNNELEPWLFQHGLDVVSIVHDRGEATMRIMDAVKLQVALNRRLNFVQTLKKEVKPLQGLPLRLATQWLSQTAFNCCPDLESIRRCPVYGPDWTLYTQTGYAASAKVWVDLEGLRLPAVPESPTKDQMVQAREHILEDVLIDFPFRDQASKANALAFAMAPFLRTAIKGAIPLFLVQATMPGSGKSLLVDALSTIAVGNPAKKNPESKGEELRKQITALLLQASEYVVLDNVNDEIDSGALASVLTTRWWQDRKLGQSLQVKMRNDAIWSATANAPTMSPEISRRICPISLAPDVEDPQTRSVFKHADLLMWCKMHRPKLLKALLTMVNFWREAGAPDGSYKLGSFEYWSQATSGILDVCEVPGFMGNVEALWKGTIKGQWENFINIWWQDKRTLRLRSKELAVMAYQADLLRDIVGEGQTPKAVAMGKALAKQLDRVYTIYGTGHLQDQPVEKVRVRKESKRSNTGQKYYLELITKENAHSQARR